MEGLEQRLYRLERSERLLKRVLFAMVFVTTALCVTASMNHNRGQTIEAERFVIRDSSGQYRGELGISPDGVPALVLTAKPDSTAVARLPESMGGIYLFDHHGDQQAAFQVGHRGGAEVLVGDSLLAVIIAGEFMVYKNGIRTWASSK